MLEIIRQPWILQSSIQGENKMKKIISGVTVLSMLLMINVPIGAVELDHESGNESAKVEINTTIDSSYVVVIPESINIDFKAETTKLGTVEADWVQIEPGKKVVVTANPGKLENVKDTAKTISYQLLSDKDKFQEMDILTADDKVDLNIAISEVEWNRAYAGKYKGIITFTLFYEDIV